MKISKGFINFVLLLTVLVFAQQALAATMPVSTYCTAQHNWQGSRYYTETTNSGSISCRVDYAVYDTLGTKSTAENTFINSIGSVMPNMEQYLYVYQVFNDLTDSAASIASFAIFNLDKTALNVASQNINAADDSAGGIEPTDHGALDNTGTKVVWDFGGKLILKTDHSWFLVLSSVGGPVRGGFEVTSSDSYTPTPSPEPATIALLSTGALMIAGRRKRK